MAQPAANENRTRQAPIMSSYQALKFGHPEEIEMMRAEVHKFAQAEIAPLAATLDETNEFPQEM